MESWDMHECCESSSSSTRSTFTHYLLRWNPLEGRELDAWTAFPMGKNWALNEVRAISVHAKVDLVKLTVARLIGVALDIWSVPNCIFHSLLDVRQGIRLAVGFYTCLLKSLKEVGFLFEVKSCCKVTMLVNGRLGAGSVFIPLMCPERNPTAARAS